MQDGKRHSKGNNVVRLARVRARKRARKRARDRDPQNAARRHHYHPQSLDKLKEKAHEETTLHGHTLPYGDIFKFGGLVVFFAIIAVIIYFLWPYMGNLFSSDGREELINTIRGAGWSGVFIVLGIQFLQVVVAFIPGEVVQVAAGIIYGPWIGALLILLGCVISSAVIYLLVKKLGAPFVQDMVPEKFITVLDRLEETGKLTLIVFVLFLVPGLPKDVFSYLVPLTPMKMSTYLIVTNLARIPGIVLSTYAADGLMDGRVGESIAMFAVLAVVAVVALIVSNRVMQNMEAKRSDKPSKK